ncbi:ubiquitin thioesterase otulin [Sander vitreus]
MGNCCCRPESPCGSAEERSGLLKDDPKATVSTGETLVVGNCGPEKDDDIRKVPEEASIKVEEAVQVKQSPEVAEMEPNNVQENGPLQKVVLQTATPSSKKSELKENSTRAQDKDVKDRPTFSGQAEPLQCTSKEHTTALWEAFRNEASEEENPASAQGKIPDGSSLTAGAVCPENHTETNTTRAHNTLDTTHDNDEEAGSKVTIENAVAEPAGESSQKNEVLSVPNTPLTAAACQVSSISGVSQENGKESPSCALTKDSEKGSSSACKEAGPEVVQIHVCESSPESEPAGLDHCGEERDSTNCVREPEPTAPADASQSDEDLYRGAEELSASPETTLVKVEDRCSLSPAVDILFYSEREWKGNTAKSVLIRKGYKEMSQRFGSVRRVRGDNYCALRATLFQVLSHSTQLPAWLQEGNNMLLKQLEAQEGLISQWTFRGECLQGDGIGDATVQLKGYMELLRNTWQAAVDCSSAVERQQLCERVFQGGEEELRLLEALKLLMLGRAVELHSCMQGGGDIPLFCWLLFARDSSDCPRSFLSNHLSHVGLSAGLEQVEMFLLGYALQCTIQVYRLYKADTEEFITYFPDDHKDDWPSVCLVTEDDRHYNVPVVEAAEELHKQLNSS